MGAAAERVGGRLLDPTIAYLTGDTLQPKRLARAYRVLEAMPFQLKRLRVALRARDVGTLTVKKRGSAVDLQALRRQLRLRGAAAATIVLTRVGGAPTVLLVEREPAGAAR